jgi:RHS repeat-associated protein
MSGILNQSLGFSYNNDFLLSRLTYAGSSVDYLYDNDGLLTRSGIFTVTRNASNGLPTSLTGGQLSLSRTFSGYGEMDAEDLSVAGLPIRSWNLTRDHRGKITRKNETVGGISSEYTYAYDSAGRLLSVTRDGSVVEEYAYGANGTRISERNTLRGIPQRTMSYSEEDHLLTAGETSYQYDLDGFLTTRTQGAQVTQYDYSSWGELLGVTLPDGRTIEYIHDPLGRRIAKRIDGIVTEKYLWQGITRLLALYDGSDNLIMRFQYADSRMPVAMTKGSSTYYIAYDQVGSPELVTDSTGTVVKRMDYDSFGNLLHDSNPAFKIPLGFAGGLFDPDTGLVRFGFRDYDPDVGHWSAKDPIFFQGGDIDLYGYVQNDPVNMVDPDGLVAAQVIGGIIGAAYGMYAAHNAGTSIVQGALVGGLTGVLSTLPIPGLNPLLSGALIGSFFGGLGTFINEAADPCTSIDWTAVGKSALAGGIGGAIGSKIANTQITQNITDPLLDSVRKNPLFTDYGQKTVGAATAGIIGGGLDVVFQ